MSELQLFDQQPDLLHPLRRVREARARENQDELLATESARNVAAPQPIAKQPAELAQDTISGVVPERIVEPLQIVQIEHGDAHVEKMTFAGPSVNIALAGSASIPARELDLTGTAALTVADRRGAPFELPFVVQGSWDDPIMLPDVEALIRRSGAAAPLLNAAHERNARDAVRAVLDRLSGGRSSSSEPASAKADTPAANAAKP